MAITFGKLFSLFYNLLYFLLKYRNLKILFFVFKYKINRSELIYNRTDKTIFISKINLNVSLDKHLFLIEKYNITLSLQENLNPNWSITDGQIMINFDNICFNIACWEELFIIDEVFVKGVYNFNTNNNFVFYDVGMNVGITSLFFALKPNVTKVHAYEPFRQTFESASINFNLNKEIASKINANNFGISSENKSLTVDYLFDLKGSVGIEGIQERTLVDNDNLISKENIIVKKASTIFSQLIQKDSDEKLDHVLKLDCEGSEYEILTELDSANLLQKFSIIMLEWHNKGPQDIQKILLTNGFSLFSFDFLNKDIGMIYAFKN